MSDVGRLRKSGGSVFPTIRKSADPFQPEMGEMDFSQEIEEHDAIESTSVREPEKTEQSVIRDENKRKQYRQRKRKRKKDDEKTEGEGDVLIDLRA
jgi:hypothetical protein